MSSDEPAAPIHVLLVDDHPAFLEMATEKLEQVNERLEILQATSTEAGLERLDERDIDCIVADYAMDERDGIAFLETVRDEHGELPFIVYTGKGSEAVAAEAISLGVTDYLRKQTAPEHYTLLANRIVNAVERYRAQQSLEASEREFRQIHERITDGFFSVDTQWRYTYVNDEGARIVDRSPQELVGKTVWDAFPGLVDSPFEEALRTAMESQQTTSVEEYFPPHDAWYEVRVYGDDEGLSIYFRDTTERQEREQELREATRRLNLALEATDTGVWEYNLETEEVRWSDSLERLLGIEPGSFDETDEAHEEYLHPEDVQTVKQAAKEAIRSHGSFDAEFRMIREDGDTIWVRGRGEYVEENGPDRMIGTTTDITVLKEREAELQRQQAETTRLKDRLEHALQATDTYVWDWDRKTDEIERYPDPDSIFELSEPALGPGVEDWLEHVHPDDRPSVEAEMEQAFESGTGYKHECRFDIGQERYRWIRVRAVIETEDGESVRAIGTVTDVTQQMQRERTLRRFVENIDDLIDTDSREETCQVAKEIAGHVLDVPLVGIHLISDEGDRLEAVAARDAVREEFGVPPSYDRNGDEATEELVWEVYESGESLYIEDTRNHGQLAEETPARSGVVHPLADHGVLIASTTERDAFDETDRAYVELLAQALTAVLGRFEREEELRHQNQQLEQLHRAGQEIIQAGTRADIAERLVDGAQSILNYTIAMVRYYDDEVGGLVPIAATDEVDEVFESRTAFTPNGGSLNWSVYESGSPAVFDDINEFEQAVDSDTPVQSLMVIPIGEHGTISVGSTAAHRFDEGDVSLTQLLATTAELALSNLEREAELVSQRDELRRQNERLDEFASIVSHDLRNPLGVAQGRLSLAAEEGESENLDAVARALDRMETLIDDLLSLASVGEAVGELEPVELSAVVETCWETVDTDAAQLVVDSGRAIRADRSRLQQLLENLLRNAVEHGGPDTTVTIGDLPEGFYVEDDGPGIPAAKRDDVLNPGYSTREGGTGFGLSIVRNIAEAHDWEIDVTEGSSGGARFEFRGVDTE